MAVGGIPAAALSLSAKGCRLAAGTIDRRLLVYQFDVAAE